MKKSISTLLIVALTLCLATLGGCANVIRRSDHSFFAMDTEMTLTIYYDGDGEKLLLDCEEIVKNLETLLSISDTGSEIHELNMNEILNYPSEHLLNILTKAKIISERSGGLFDVTVYPLVDAWGFYGDNPAVPSQEAIEAAKSGIDYKKLEFSEEKIVTNGAKIDLGGIAKGYTGRILADFLLENGVYGGVIVLGGNVQVFGKKSTNKEFLIGIADPQNTSENCLLFSGTDTAIITSGNYQRFFEENGEVYHHILDPKSGVSADTGLLSVSVFCEDGTIADALSTALFLLGLEDGLNYHATYGGFEAVFVGEDGVITATSGLEGKIELCSDEYQLQYK